MLRTWRLSVGIVWLLVLAGMPALADLAWQPSADQGLARARADHRLLFLEIVSSRVAASVQRDKDVYAHPRLAALLGEFSLARIDAERDRAGADKWDPTGFPTLVVLQADGTEIARPLGTLDASALAERLEEILRDERSLNALREKLVAEPGHVPSQLELARIYLRRGLGVPAKPLVEQLAKAENEKAREAMPSLWLNLGIALGQGGFSPKGKECFARVTQDFPQSREAGQAYFYLHMVYLMQGDRAAATRSLEKLLEVSRDDYLRERAERALKRLKR